MREFSRQYQKPTVRNVAKLAGVSVTTVSHVVNGVRSYAPETVRKVNEAIAALQYTPSFIARGARQQLTYTLGVCGGDPLRTAPGPSKQFAEALWRGAAEEADRTGFSLLYYSAAIRNNPNPEAFLNGFVDGLLMLVDPFDPRPPLLAAAGLPVVMQATGPVIPDGVGAAYVDDASLMIEGLDCLWELGHRRIAHVGPECAAETGTPDGIAANRRAAWKAWMSPRDPDTDSLLAICDGWAPAELSSILVRWRSLPNPPTAVFCANDAIALRLMKDAAAMGILVPSQLSVLGIDGDTETRAQHPELATITVPVKEIGKASVEALLNMLRGEPAEACRICIPAGPLIFRPSLAPLQVS